MLALEGRTKYGYGDNRHGAYPFKPGKDAVIPYGLGFYNEMHPLEYRLKNLKELIKGKKYLIAFSG